MKKIISTLLLAVGCAIAVTNISGQTPTSDERRVTPAEYDILRRTGQVSNSAERDTGSLNKARLGNAKKQIAPSSVVENQYKDFLRQPNTGIVRLVFPKECPLAGKKAFDNPDKFAKECPTQYLPGNGSNFSFRKKEYFFPSHSDITIKDELIFSDTFFAQNIMVRLGDVPLEQISLGSEGVKFLTDFVPATVAADADKQIAQFNKGLQNNQYKYAKGFRTAAHTTYALRVIPYNGDSQVEMSLLLERSNHNSQINPAANKAFSPKVLAKDDPLAGDRREDIIVVFRIIEREADGSVTLLWRELQRKDSPQISLK